MVLTNRVFISLTVHYTCGVGVTKLDVKFRVFRTALTDRIQRRRGVVGNHYMGDVEIKRRSFGEIERKGWKWC